MKDANLEHPSHVELVVAVLSAIDRENNSNLLRAAGEIAAAIGKWNLTHRNLYPAAKEIGRRGWTTPVWSHTTAVAEIIAATTPATIDEYFVREFNKGWTRLERRIFRDLLSSTNLAPWHELLGDAVFGYRRQHYRLVVPALFAIYEGALAHAMGQLQRKSDPKNLAREKRDGAHEGLLKLAWMSVESFTLRLFEAHPFAQPRPTIINRNWVLHGRDSGAWSRADCLRLFQALHTVAFLEDADGSLRANLGN